MGSWKRAVFPPVFSVNFQFYSSLFLSRHMLSPQLELSNLLVTGEMEIICQSQEPSQHLSPIREPRFLLVINVRSGNKHLHTEPSFVIPQVTQKHLWGVSTACSERARWVRGPQPLRFAVGSCEEVIRSVSTVLPSAEFRRSPPHHRFHDKFPSASQEQG